MSKLFQRMFVHHGFRIGVVLLLVSSILVGQERRPPVLKGGVQHQERRQPVQRGGAQQQDQAQDPYSILNILEPECEAAREALDLYREAAANPELVLSERWNSVEDRAYQALASCFSCPMGTLKIGVELLRRAQVVRLNPQARVEVYRRLIQLTFATDPPRRPVSVQAFDQAVERWKQKIRTILQEAEQCFQSSCVETLQVIRDAESRRGKREKPPTKSCEDASPISAYGYGFIQGLASCVSGLTYGTIMAIARDFNDFQRVALALSQGDAETAARILQIKGERNRREFDNFVKSLNPNIYGVPPQEAGFRDGSRLCQFGLVSALAKAARVKALPPTARVLAQSGIVVQDVELAEASALEPINSKAGVGYAFEIYQKGNLPPNFKTIDRVPPVELENAAKNGGALTNPSEIASIKTVSATPTSPTYAVPGAIFSTLKGYIFKLQNFSTYCKCGTTIIAGPNTRRVIEVGIPESATAQQLAEVDQAAVFARQNGVEMRVFLLSGVKGW